MGYSTSTIYGEGQKFYSSVDQGSTYLGITFAGPLRFDANYTVTEPRSSAIVQPTITNYNAPPHDYFMGTFSGFWVHNVYRDGFLIYTCQGVNQDLFIPIQYDYVQSVSMSFSAETIPYDGPVKPPVPTTSVFSALLIGLAITSLRKRAR
jgi:hypothetical protein